MGFLKRFKTAKPEPPIRIPSGSFSVDPEGNVVASTLPQAFPEVLVLEISQTILTTFREARHADLPLSELNLEYKGFRLTARELRGGALVFLSPLRLGQS